MMKGAFIEREFEIFFKFSKISTNFLKFNFFSLNLNFEKRKFQNNRYFNYFCYQMTISPRFLSQHPGRTY